MAGSALKRARNSRVREVDAEVVTFVRQAKGWSYAGCLAPPLTGRRSGNDHSIEDPRDIYRVFDQQMSTALRVSEATSADDVVDALLTAALRFASAPILRHPNRRELLRVLPERLDQYIAEIQALRRKAGYPDD